MRLFHAGHKQQGLAGRKRGAYAIVIQRTLWAAQYGTGACPWNPSRYP